MDTKSRHLRDGEPCSHRGCLSHITHPCEGCGRIGGRSRLKKCPCGKVPEKLISIRARTEKYAYAYSSCCMDWFIEYDTEYHDLSSNECRKLAIEAWNNTPRGDETLNATLLGLVRDLYTADDGQAYKEAEKLFDRLGLDIELDNAND